MISWSQLWEPYIVWGQACELLEDRFHLVISFSVHMSNNTMFSSPSFVQQSYWCKPMTAKLFYTFIINCLFQLAFCITCNWLWNAAMIVLHYCFFMYLSLFFVENSPVFGKPECYIAHSFRDLFLECVVCYTTIVIDTNMIGKY